MSTATAPATSVQGGVWAELIGQERVVATLRRAVEGERHAMTHAWLFTGPPGSGRSNAARAFAAGLQCVDGGCGSCQACVTALSGAHPDVTVVRTEKLSIGVDEVRELVRRAAMAPTLGRYQVLIVEDADRVTERGADALLKAIEEPAARTVWLLCAPTADDVIVTIRSRCRRVELRTPSETAVAELLQRRDGVSSELAGFAARASQGHVGRARALARSEAARQTRTDILALPQRLGSLGQCLDAAAEMVKRTGDEAAAITAELDAKELAELSEALGMGTKGARPRSAQAALSALADEQKLRAKRLQRDALDRVLTELTSYYRDVLVVQTNAGSPIINAEFTEPIADLAAHSTPSATLRRLDAVLACRTALETNVAPLLAMEALMIGLARP